MIRFRIYIMLLITKTLIFVNRAMLCAVIFASESLGLMGVKLCYVDTGVVGG